MTPAADYRSHYRDHEIGAHYSGWRHLGFTLTGCSLLIAACIAALRNVAAIELAAVPLTMLYANLVEWLAHRGPMHKPMWPIKIIYERHALQHHKFFTDRTMPLNSPRDFHAVLFPPAMLAFFFGCFALPVGVALAWLTTANVALLFVATSFGYFLNYELLHLAYHIGADSFVGRLPFMGPLRRLHTTHHNPALMSRYNFNITYPICDRLFGTRYRGKAP